jgi:hypothetical protein
VRHLKETDSHIFGRAFPKPVLITAGLLNGLRREEEIKK